MGRKMTRFLTKCAILLGGMYATGLALWNLGNTAVFVYKSITLPGVVVDVKERPFDGYLEMLQHGNMPWQGSTAYQPHVRYSISNYQMVDTTLPDWDSRNYVNDQPVEIILDPTRPGHRHINSARFLWLGDLLLLAFGVGVLLLARYIIWGRRRKRHPHTAPHPTATPTREAPATRHRDEPAPPKAPAATTRRTPRKQATPAEAPKEETFTLQAEDPPAPRKRSRKSSSSTGTGSRSKSAASADKPKRTGRSRKATTASSTDTATTPKRRRKKADTP